MESRRVDDGFVPAKRNRNSSTGRVFDVMADRFYLVRVTTDDRERQVWVAAVAREQAVDRVLNAVPEGWTAVLLADRLSPVEAKALNLKRGEVRVLSGAFPKAHGRH
jgi:hypothetical protein